MWESEQECRVMGMCQLVKYNHSTQSTEVQTGIIISAIHGGGGAGWRREACVTPL